MNLTARYIEEANYDDLFQQFSDQLEKSIKVPKFATVMQNDFSTTSGPHKIASQINLMGSLQEFFEYSCDVWMRHQSRGNVWR